MPSPFDIEIDPIEIDTDLDGETNGHPARERARSILSEMAAGPSDVAGLDVPAPPGAPSPGAVPPPDPVTAARGEREIFGGPDPQLDAVPYPSSPYPGLPGGAPAQPLQGPPQAPPAPQAPRPPPMMQPPPAQALATPPRPPPQPGPSPAAAPTPRERLRELLMPAGQAVQAQPDERPDYTGIDIADRLVSPVRAIGRGLIRASGGNPGPATTWGGTARARDAAAAEAGGEDAMAERRMALLEGNAQSMDARRTQMSERDVVREDRQASQGERSLDLREQAQEPARERMAALLDFRAQTREDRQAASSQDQQELADRRDPESSASDSARVAGRALAAQLRESSGFEIAEEGASILESGTAEQVDAWRQDVLRSGVGRGTGRRRRRGGGGGASRQSSRGASGMQVARDMMGTDEDPLVQAAIRQGMDPGVVRDAAANNSGGRSSPRRQLINRVTSAEVQQGVRQRERDRTHRIPGYERREGAPELSSAAINETRDIARADAEFARVLSRIESSLGELTATERAAGVGNLGGERFHEIQMGIGVIRNQIRTINNSGSSLGAQRMVEHEIPDLTQRTTVASLLANLRAARRIKHLYVVAAMEQAGYDRTSGGEGGGASGAPRQRASAPTGGVRYRLPSGSITTELTPEQVTRVRARFPTAVEVQ